MGGETNGGPISRGLLRSMVEALVTVLRAPASPAEAGKIDKQDFIALLAALQALIAGLASLTSGLVGVQVVALTMLLAFLWAVAGRLVSGSPTIHGALAFGAVASFWMALALLILATLRLLAPQLPPAAQLTRLIILAFVIVVLVFSRGQMPLVPRLGFITGLVLTIVAVGSFVLYQ